MFLSIKRQIPATFTDPLLLPRPLPSDFRPKKTSEAIGLTIVNQLGDNRR